VKKIYIAGPWFTQEANDIIEEIKDENLYTPGDDPKATVLANCQAITYCDYMIAVTDGKDVGTMFECGYAFSKGVPILYLWLGREDDQKFNVMLAGSGEVCHSYTGLATQVRFRKEHGMFIKVVDKGLVLE
jgi:nucleoside 2-deoxyribosyltransferase